MRLDGKSPCPWSQLNRTWFDLRGSTNGLCCCTTEVYWCGFLCAFGFLCYCCWAGKGKFAWEGTFSSRQTGWLRWGEAEDEFFEGE